MCDSSRRTFIGMSLLAAGAELISRTANAAEAAQGKHTSEQGAGIDSAHAAAWKPRAIVPTQGTVYLLVYRPGEKWHTGQPLEAQPLREHARYMLSLHREGTLRHAGRFVDGSGGAAVFTAADDATATMVVEKDPAVISKVFAYDLRRWAWVDWEKLRPATGG